MPVGHQDSCGTDKWTGGPYLRGKKKMSSETCGGKEGLTGIQPRMRLDLPPGGFLRPDGTPAAGSSAGGASSCGSGTASGSATQFSTQTGRRVNKIYIWEQQVC